MRITKLVVGLCCLCAIGASGTKEDEEKESKLQRCVPKLNLDALINGSLSPPPPPPPVAAGLLQAEETNSAELVLVEGPQVVPSLLSSLSFKVEDIVLPLAPNEGSLHSAIRLISSFNDQFDSPGEEEEEGGQGAALADNMIRFRNNRLNIRGLNLTMLNVHLYTDSEPKFGLGVSLKNTTLSGQFVYSGPLQLGGFYRMSIDNAHLVASSNLTKAAAWPQPGLNLELSMRAKDFKLNITDLGYISIEILDAADSQGPTNNYLLRMLQRLLQKTIKRAYYTFEGRIRESLERESSQMLDCELKRFTPFLEQSFATNSQHLDDLSRIIGQQIVSLQLHSVQLPSFEHHQAFLGANPTIQFHNGSLSGLDRMKLVGETKIKLQDEHLLVNSSLGWTDLRPYYNWALVLSNSSGNSRPSARGYVAFNIKTVEFEAVITKGLNPHARLVVERLEIRRLDGPKMDIGGLPGLNRITRGMVNFFMSRLKQRLVSSIQPALKQQLERSLNRMQGDPVG